MPVLTPNPGNATAFTALTLGLGSKKGIWAVKSLPKALFWYNLKKETNGKPTNPGMTDKQPLKWSDKEIITIQFVNRQLISCRRTDIKKTDTRQRKRDSISCTKLTQKISTTNKMLQTKAVNQQCYLLDGLDLGRLVVPNHALRSTDLEEWKVRLLGHVGRNCCLSAARRTWQHAYEYSAMSPGPSNVFRKLTVALNGLSN